MCVILGILLSACANQIPDMTEEQNAMVAEYAAAELLQHSGNYHSRLVDTSVPNENAKEEEGVVEESSGNESEKDVTNQETEGSGVLDENTMQTEENESVDGMDAEAEMPAMTIAQVLGLSGVEVNYTGYRVYDSYPDEEVSPENMFFAMDASNGMKLLVLTLDITNVTTEPVQLDTMALSAKYRVILNGEYKKNSLVTMLDNDFTAFKKGIEAGETISSVVVTEIEQESVDGLQSVGLEVKCQDNKTVVTQ